MKKALFCLGVTFILGNLSWALEPQNPVTLCDRFVTEIDKASCEKQLTQLAPDWYLASLCGKFSEDAGFYRCMGLSKSMEISPKKLEACDQAEATDEGRLSCIQSAKVSAKATAFQPLRAPASHRVGSVKSRE